MPSRDDDASPVPDVSDLGVLDARDVEAGLVARVHLPRRLPFGFHANWFAAP